MIKNLKKEVQMLDSRIVMDRDYFGDLEEKVKKLYQDRV